MPIKVTVTVREAGQAGDQEKSTVCASHYHFFSDIAFTLLYSNPLQKLACLQLPHKLINWALFNAPWSLVKINIVRGGKQPRKCDPSVSIAAYTLGSAKDNRPPTHYSKATTLLPLLQFITCRLPHPAHISRPNQLSCCLGILSMSVVRTYSL